MGITLFRVVEPSEKLDIIAQNYEYRLPNYLNVKYFVSTYNELNHIFQLWNIVFGPNHFRTYGHFDFHIFGRPQRIYVAGEGTAWILNNAHLPHRPAIFI